MGALLSRIFRGADKSTELADRGISLDGHLKDRLSLPHGPIALLGQLIWAALCAVGAVVLGWLASLTAWLTPLGPFGWFLIGLAGVVLLSIAGLAAATMAARARTAWRLGGPEGAASGIGRSAPTLAGTPLAEPPTGPGALDLRAEMEANASALRDQIGKLEIRLAEIKGKASQGEAAFTALRAAAAASFLRIEDKRCSKVIASIESLSATPPDTEHSTFHLIEDIDGNIADIARDLLGAGIAGASALVQELRSMDEKRRQRRSVMDIARSNPVARWGHEREMLFAKAASLHGTIKKAKEGYITQRNAPLEDWRPES